MTTLRAFVFNEPAANRVRLRDSLFAWMRSLAPFLLEVVPLFLSYNTAYLDGITGINHRAGQHPRWTDGGKSSKCVQTVDPQCVRTPRTPRSQASQSMPHHLLSNLV